MLEPVETIGKLQKNYNVTIPKRIREIFHLQLGDFIRFVVRKDGILMQPNKLVDSTQAYFWTKEWQENELKAEKDIKTGRVSKTKNMKELLKKLKAK